MTSRLDQINRLYEVLDDLEDRLGGKRCLSECHGKMNWPKRGVYFFFEQNERRTSGLGLRVVRVGTHALNRNSKTTLWSRLRAHRGSLSGKHAGGGNHRGSIFRLHVGTAHLQKEGLRGQYPTWGIGSSAPQSTMDHELPIEKKVSQHIRAMPFLWLNVSDHPGPQSLRAYLERNSIILLSNYSRVGTVESIDLPSPNWLGLHCENPKVRQSGLWNDDHVEEKQVDATYLDKLEKCVRSHSRNG